MSIIKEKIKFVGKDMNLKFILNSGSNYIGQQQEINNFANDKSKEVIPLPVDVETIRFSYFAAPYINYFNFYNTTTSTYSDDFSNINFSNEDIDGKNNAVLNSFFILDFYDSTNSYTQNKIFSTYLTNITQGEYNNKSSYLIDKNNQLYYLYVPQYFINDIEDNIIYLYAKFSFYNAKNGKISLFYDSQYDLNENPDSMYVIFGLNLTTKKWNRYRYVNNNLVSSFSNLTMEEITTKSEYTDKVNKSIVKVDNRKQTFPTGNIFNRDSGTYSNV